MTCLVLYIDNLFIEMSFCSMTSHVLLWLMFTSQTFQELGCKKTHISIIIYWIYFSISGCQTVIQREPPSDLQSQTFQSIFSRQPFDVSKTKPVNASKINMAWESTSPKTSRNWKHYELEADCFPQILAKAWCPLPLQIIIFTLKTSAGGWWHWIPGW